MTAQQDPPATAPAISLVMPTITWGQPFACCLQAALAGLGPSDELLVVFDGPPSALPPWLEASAATVLHTGQRSGPAAARNLAATEARSEVLLFVDADVELHPDAVERVRRHFGADPSLQALFGSYDDRPAAAGVVSRFRNLLHHHTHTSQPGPACTFWAGCGAVRRERFLALGGFDAQAYRQPCIEDIEFGLRLHDDGGKILLDPTIQGTHHKRWTLSLMVRTDIQQRAIPWSRLLLSRRQIPPTLNLSTSARISAGLSLVTIFSLFGILIPNLWPFSLITAGSAITGLIILNGSLLRLLLRSGGFPLAIVGTGLLTLYLSYSSLTFTTLFLLRLGNYRVQPQPPSLRPKETVRYLRKALICALAVAAAYAILRGSFALWMPVPSGIDDSNDLPQRYAEWRLFRQGIYPIGDLAGIKARSLPYFKTSIYLPWALPMFAVLFYPGGFLQGRLMIWVGSLLSLALISVICWHCLRPWGKEAGWLGALAPLAIANNNICLSVSQFSIICMGLISLQWVSLRKRRSIPAGLYWALAMIKPQIALPFAIPMLRRNRLTSLILGAGVLLALSAFALAHTSTQPKAMLSSWLRIISKLDGKGTRNVLSGLISLAAGIPLPILLLIFIAASCAVIYLANRLANRAERLQDNNMWDLAGLCATLGYMSFYHRHYDSIMLFPAMLACFREGYKRPTLFNIIPCVLIAAIAWLPERLWMLMPHSETIALLIPALVGASLMLRIIKSKTPPDPALARA